MRQASLLSLDGVHVTDNFAKDGTSLHHTHQLLEL